MYQVSHGVYYYFLFRAFNALLHLRDITWRSVDFFVHFYDAHDQELDKIRDFRKELRSILTKLI